MSKKYQKTKKEGKKSQPKSDGTDSDPIIDRERKHSQIVLIMTFLGMIILFSSWISQNYFKSRWLDERLYLEKTQFLIEIEGITTKQCEMRLNTEAMKNPQDTTLYSLAAYNYIESLTRILAWEEARISEDERKQIPILVKNLTQTGAKEMLKKNDLNGLLQLASSANEIQNKFIKGLDEEYFSQLGKAILKSSFWDRMFLLLYVIGSLLIGTRWILVNFFSWPNKYLKKAHHTTQSSA